MTSKPGNAIQIAQSIRNCYVNQYFQGIHLIAQRSQQTLLNFVTTFSEFL